MPEGGASLGRVAARLAKHVELGLAELDVSPAQYRVLLFLAEGPAGASRLAGRADVSPPSITALVDGLVTRGLVERQPDPDDRRRVAQVLTDAGRRVLADADDVLERRLRQIAACLPGRRGDRAVSGLAEWKDALDANLRLGRVSAR
jgi:DNA-binding MarR family transcriptional regulator